MKIMMLWAYYSHYIDLFSSRHTDWDSLSYEEIIRLFENDHNGWPIDLSVCLRELGVDTNFIIANCEHLQKKWARQKGVSYSEENWVKEIALEQVKDFRPDVLWIPSMFYLYGDFSRECKKYSRKMMSWISCSYPKNLDTSDFHYFITSHEDMLKDRHDSFEKVLFIMPGFSAKILDHIGTIEKNNSIFFGGMLTPAHIYRIKILSELAKDDRFSLELSGGKSVPDVKNIVWTPFRGLLGNKDVKSFFRAIGDVPGALLLNIRASCLNPRPAVFGIEYYNKISSSLMALDIHGEIAKGYAGNMRMFETTGVGTCLVTEHSKNIERIFSPDEEIVTFGSIEELKEKLLYLQSRKDVVSDIARKGQEKTLQCYSIEKMAEKILDWLR